VPPSPRSEREIRGRPRDEANDIAILDATERLLGRRGYEAMTLDQVAAAAGVSKPTIYLRYRSKRDLVAAMIDRLQPPLPQASTGSVARDLIALIDMEREWVDLHGLRIVAAVLLEQDEHPELMARFQQRVVEPVRRAFAEVLQVAVDRGELPPTAASPEAIDALTGAYWARAWAIEGFPADWSDRLVGALLDLVNHR
jgi:AcrR family transcriptional regulator